MTESGPDPEPMWRGTLPLTAGVLALVALLVGVGYWSVRVHISGAIVAPGRVEADGGFHVVRHPIGGTVQEILVQENDLVDKGALLVRLGAQDEKSQLYAIEQHLIGISAHMARLVAERDEIDEVAFSPMLLSAARTNPRVRALLEIEHKRFAARREALEEERDLREEKNIQINLRIKALEGQKSALGEQSILTETAMKEAQPSRINGLKRDISALKAQVGSLEAKMAELRGQKASDRLAFLRLRAQRREAMLAELQKLNDRSAELASEKLALEDAIAQLEIRAPVGGVIRGRWRLASQSIVGPGQPLMSITPQGQGMLISARVDPANLDSVYPEQEVSLRFLSIDQKDIPELRGTISDISATEFRDEQTGATYHAVTIRPTIAEQQRPQLQDLLPGSAVDVLVHTRSRSPLGYLAEPITSFFQKTSRN